VLQAGDLSMHCQPSVDLTTLDVVGFEGLILWRHRERGWIPPDLFIALAEQSQLILEPGSFAHAKPRERRVRGDPWTRTPRRLLLP
jgi:EAL domain-containing protein (putative c-di-GMP-specific phosphodiesterase class I)